MFKSRLPALAAAALTLAPITAAPAQRERLAPPAAVTCPRDNLTVYFGRVTSYRRTTTRIDLRIRTDYDTDETVTLRYRRGVNPARWFLLRARRFRQRDWERIEGRPGQLHANMRANVWVCSDGSNPVVDWQPPSE